jgi:hypothetical protein
MVQASGVRLPAVPYLSDIQHRHVLDAGGDDIGRVKDLAIVPSETYPVVQWAILGTSDGERVLRWGDLAMEPAHVRLRRRLETLAPETLPPGAVRLGRDVLDERIVDTRDATVVRVNDLHLEESGRELRLVGADVGSRGLLRRIGIERLAEGLSRLAGRRLPRHVVPWTAVRLEPEHELGDGEVDDEARAVDEGGDQRS